MDMKAEKGKEKEGKGRERARKFLSRTIKKKRANEFKQNILTVWRSSGKDED